MRDGERTRPHLATRGCSLGHLVADPVDLPYEFREASEIGEVVFRAKGSHGEPAGTWSDEGALILALLDPLLQGGGFDPGGRGEYAPGAKLFDIGGTTGAGLRAFERGTPAVDAGPADDNTSGMAR